jgi:hypothetical protein
MILNNTFEGSKKPQHMEDALEMLGKYDTVILLDDSSSMNDPGSMKGGTRWYEVKLDYRADVTLIHGPLSRLERHWQHWRTRRRSMIATESIYIF